MRLLQAELLKLRHPLLLWVVVAIVEELSRLVVRHEVPFDRVEVQGLHRWPVAAGW
jgi:hypothetical protein